MSMKRIIISYPSTSKFLEFIEKKEYSNDSKISDVLNDFFESKESDVVPMINESDFNILVFNTNTKQITGDVQRILNEYQDKLDTITKSIKVYSIDYVYPIDIIGNLPQLTHMLPKLSMQNKFSLIICQNELLKTCLPTHFKDYINDHGLLIMDKNSSLNFDNIQGWNRVKLLESFHTFEPIISNREELEYNIYDSDLKLSQLLLYSTSNNLDRLELNEYLSGFIRTYIQNNIVEVKLSRKLINVLIMCSDESSIKRNKCLAILQRCIGINFDYDLVEFYHIGKNILHEEYPYISRCLVNNFNLLNSTKFDVIVSDSCPIVVINSNIQYISNLLKSEGGLILPKTKKQISGYSSDNCDSSEYSMFLKN